MNKPAQMKNDVHPKRSPRLYISSEQLARLSQPETIGFLKAAAGEVLRRAEKYAASMELAYDPQMHNALLDRAREMQKRVMTLVTAWLIGGGEQYREAALENVRAMGRWTYWSWDAALKKDPRPEAGFDLSYGENSATLAFAYDLLFDSLTEAHRSELRELAVRWSFQPFIARLGEPAQRPWWFNHAGTNWNSVCCGGAGMLALAMRGEVPETARVLQLAEESIAGYMKDLKRTNGGWVEGIGYWNYGHRYAFMYLLSHERSTGRMHPLLRPAAVAQTLRFPLDFCPNGEPSSFGDVNAWAPLPFHYAAALRLKCPDVTAALNDAMTAAHDDRTKGGDPGRGGSWADAAEWLLLHDRIVQRPIHRDTVATRHAKLSAVHYPNMDWYALANRDTDPPVFLTIRGGSTKVPHGQCDLLSFHCVVGHEQMISTLSNKGGVDYLDTTFGNRRPDIFEMTPAAKNTLLLNGVGIMDESSVTSRLIESDGFVGVRLDATEAMGTHNDQVPAARFCGRLFLMLPDSRIVIVDHTELTQPGRVESRMHTWHPIDAAGASAMIRGERQRLRLSYACTVPAALYTAVTSPTTPRPGAIVLRWCTIARTHQAVTMVSVLTPGAKGSVVEATVDGDRIIVKSTWDETSTTVQMSTRLEDISARVKKLKTKKAQAKKASAKKERAKKILAR